VHAVQSFGTALLAIRTEITAEADKALMMRIAQSAVVADGKLDPQENVAVRTLAEALGLNPEKY
jgi:tellurite resistance protein